MHLANASCHPTPSAQGSSYNWIRSIQFVAPRKTSIERTRLTNTENSNFCNFVICLTTEHLGDLKNSLKRVRAFKIELEVGSVGFWGEGKTGVPGAKTSRSKEENQQQTQPTWRPRRDLNTGHISGREVSDLTTARQPTLFPNSFSTGRPHPFHYVSFHYLRKNFRVNHNPILMFSLIRVATTCEQQVTILTTLNTKDGFHSDVIKL